MGLSRETEPIRCIDRYRYKCILRNRLLQLQGLTNMKFVGQAGRLETRAGFVCSHLEAELLLQDISGFTVKASADGMMPTYNHPIINGNLLHFQCTFRSLFVAVNHVYEVSSQ